jgi:hypothetical protein
VGFAVGPYFIYQFIRNFTVITHSPRVLFFTVAPFVAPLVCINQGCDFPCGTVASPKDDEKSSPKEADTATEMEEGDELEYDDDDGDDEESSEEGSDWFSPNDYDIDFQGCDEYDSDYGEEDDYRPAEVIEEQEEVEQRAFEPEAVREIFRYVCRSPLNVFVYMLHHAMYFVLWTINCFNTPRH